MEEHKDIKLLRDTPNDYFKYLTIHADNGCEECIKIIEREYLVFYNKKQTYDSDLFEFYKNRAENYPEANSYSINYLALMYANGYFVEKNMDTAMHHYKLAAEKNNSWGIFNLGVRHMGNNTGLGLYYLKMAAKVGNILAMSELATHYRDKKKNAKAFHYCVLAAKSGNNFQLNELSLMYQEGRGTPIDLKKALELRKKVFDNDNSDLGAITHIASIYWMQRDLSYENVQNSIKYREIAAKLNHRESIFSLSAEYTHGYPTQDLFKSIEVLKMIPDFEKDEEVQKHINRRYVNLVMTSKVYNVGSTLKFYASDKRGYESFKDLVSYIMSPKAKITEREPIRDLLAIIASCDLEKIYA